MLLFNINKNSYTFIILILSITDINKNKNIVIMKEKYSYKAKIMVQKGCIFLEIILKKKKIGEFIIRRYELSLQSREYPRAIGYSRAKVAFIVLRANSFG